MNTFMWLHDEYPCIHMLSSHVLTSLRLTIYGIFVVKAWYRPRRSFNLTSKRKWPMLYSVVMVIWPIKIGNMLWYRVPLMLYKKSHLIISCHAYDDILWFVTLLPHTLIRESYLDVDNPAQLRVLAFSTLSYGGKLLLSLMWLCYWSIWVSLLCLNNRISIEEL